MFPLLELFANYKQSFLTKFPLVPLEVLHSCLQSRVRARPGLPSGNWLRNVLVANSSMTDNTTSLFLSFFLFWRGEAKCEKKYPKFTRLPHQPKLFVSFIQTICIKMLVKCKWLARTSLLLWISCCFFQSSQSSQKAR